MTEEAAGFREPNRGSLGRCPGPGASSALDSLRGSSIRSDESVDVEDVLACSTGQVVRPSPYQGERFLGLNVSTSSIAWPHLGQRTVGVAGVASRACSSRGLGGLWAPRS